MWVQANANNIIVYFLKYKTPSAMPLPMPFPPGVPENRSLEAHTCPLLLEAWLGLALSSEGGSWLLALSRTCSGVPYYTCAVSCLLVPHLPSFTLALSRCSCHVCWHPGLQVCTPLRPHSAAHTPGPATSCSSAPRPWASPLVLFPLGLGLLGPRTSFPVLVSLCAGSSSGT